MIATLLLILQFGGAHAANLRYVRTAKHQDFTRIVFEFQNPTQFEEPVIYGQGKLSVAFPDGTTVLPRQIFYKTSQIQPVRSIEFSQKETLLTAVIELSFSDFKLKAFALPDPNRVVIDAYRITPSPREMVPEESLHAKPMAKKSKEPESNDPKSMSEESAATELVPIAKKEPKSIPDTSSVQQTGNNFEVKQNAASNINRGQLKDLSEKKVNPVSFPPIKTRDAPDEPETPGQMKSAQLPPSFHGNYTLQTYMLILLNFLTIVIILLLSFNLLRKKSGIYSKHVDKTSDSLETVDERIATIDAMIDKELKKHD